MRLSSILILGLVFFFGSCCTSQKVAERKIARIVECNPQLAVADSVEVRDTIYIEKQVLKKDSIILRDTITIENEKVKVRVERIKTGSPCDSLPVPLNIEAETKTDTLYLEKKVPCPDRITVQESRPWWHGVLLAIICFCVGWVFRSFAYVLR